MMNKTQARFYFKLDKKVSLPASQIPEQVHNHSYFQGLLERNVVVIKRKGAGKVIHIMDQEKYQNQLHAYFPQGNPSNQPTKNAIQSHAQYSNSKIGRKKSKTPLVFLRGYHEVQINGKSVDLCFHTKHFNVFATVLQHLSTPKLCIVENKTPFLLAETVISREYVFMHTYGRVGEPLLKKLSVAEILVFSDYDYVGLNEYLVCKKHCNNTTFYMPANYDALRKQYPTALRKTRRGGQQKPSKQVNSSKDPLVCRLRDQLETTNQFLEQESLFHHAR